MKPTLIAIWLIIIGTGLTILLIKIGLERIKANYHRYKQAWLKRQLQNMTTNKQAAEAAGSIAEMYLDNQRARHRPAKTGLGEADNGLQGLITNQDRMVHEFLQAELDRELNRHDIGRKWLRPAITWAGMRWRPAEWEGGLGPRVCSRPYDIKLEPNQPQKSSDPGNVVSLSWYRADK